MASPGLFVEPAERRRRWLWPGLGLLVFLLSLLEMFGADNGFLRDPATSRHLAAGTLALEQGPVLATDPFTFSLAGQPWMQHQWLFDLGAALATGIGGVPLAYAFGVVLFSLAPLALWRLLMGDGTPWPVALLYVCFASVLLHAHWLLRPQLINYVLLPVFIAAWYRYPRGLSPAAFGGLLALLILWTNVHGGFVTALLFWGLAWTGRLLDNALAKRRVLDDSVLRWAVFGAVAGLATLVNPFGWNLHRQIWHMVFEIQSYALYDEYKALDFASGDVLPIGYLVIVALLIISRLLPGRGPLGWEAVFPLVAFAYFANTTQRHVLVLLIVAAVPVCRAWGGFLLHVLKGTPRRRVLAFSAYEQRSRSHLWQAPVLALLGVGVFVLSPASAGLRVGNDNVSLQAVDVLRKLGGSIQRPLTTTWNGGPLFYHLGPDFKISHDDRNEFHGDERIYDLRRLLFAKAGWRGSLRQGRYDAVILEPGWPLGYKLRNDDQWHLFYADDVTEIFIPVREPGAR